MDEAVAKSLLKGEIDVFLSEIRNRGVLKNFDLGDLEKATSDELQVIHRSLRDTLRSLGGSKS
jgi:hypothetical protein